ncbi:MAG: PEGA domain-containing protein [Candidatus Berkelbacteria bacterium]|nr:PEGA domain-containing protein [Candidatus Berkelbacteria bacterium]
MRLAKNRVSFTVVITLLILIATIAAIFWARGFKPNFKNGSIDRTGLIVVTSVPTGASVFLDGRLTSATNTNIAFLDPKTYKVRIEKDGYISWEKDIEVTADLATEIKAVLFPVAPGIKPLTTTGARNPMLSPDGGKIAYGTSGERGGLFVMPMSERPFPFRQDLRLIAKNQSGFDFTNATFTWSPDSKQIIASFRTAQGTPTSNLLLDADESEQALRDITGSLTATLNGWQQDLITQAQTRTITIPQEVKEATGTASQASPTPAPRASQPAASPQPTPTPGPSLNYYPTGLIFSPDEEKILYKSKDGAYKVYDLKNKKEYTLPQFDNFITISWYPDSAHIVVVQQNLISVIETDGTNKMNVFSGKFENGFVFAHPSGSQLVILTTLTQPEGTPPNLYAIDLK